MNPVLVGYSRLYGVPLAQHLEVLPNRVACVQKPYRTPCIMLMSSLMLMRKRSVLACCVSPTISLSLSLSPSHFSAVAHVYTHKLLMICDWPCLHMLTKLLLFWPWSNKQQQLPFLQVTGSYFSRARTYK